VALRAIALATHRALDGFRSTPDNRKAGMSHMTKHGHSVRRARARGHKPERGAGGAMRRYGRRLDPSKAEFGKSMRLRGVFRIDARHSFAG